MKDIELFKITKVIDCESGFATPGELDFGIPGGHDGPLARYIEQHGEKGKQNIRDMVEAILKGY